MIPHPIDSITVEEPKTVQNLTVFPLYLSQTGGPDYVPLSTAIQSYGLVVKEVDEDGSVPDLYVENPSPHKVLLLDGEELRGAKQNRVVNTTLLLPPRSRTKIPVSCTERGRWHYSSPAFSCPKSVMPTRARRRKTHSVSESLGKGLHYASDQAMVWEEVEALHQKVGSESVTRAMADALEKMRNDLEDAAATIFAESGQCGLMAFVNGEPVGFDLLSKAKVYAALHIQLVQSYAMEALTSRSAVVGQSSSQAPCSPPPVDLPAGKAFLEKCAAVPGRAYDSPGVGTDWRFVEDGIVGSGLEAKETWVHMAYFVEEAGALRPDTPGPLYRASRRARLRRGEG
jgi:hypothetical protein